MRRLIPLLALATLAAACASAPPSPGPSQAAPSEVVRAIDVDGEFTLMLELPTATWKAGEPITGEARLSVDTGSGTIYGSAGGPLYFAYRELTGHRVMEPVWDAACAPHQIGAGSPITAPLGKSGAWSDDEPDGAFYHDFFTNMDVRLPAGDWVVTASAGFVVGKDCTGGSHDLAAPIVIHVR